MYLHILCVCVCVYTYAYSDKINGNKNNINTCNAFHMKYKATVLLGYAINVMLATSPAGRA